MDKGMKKVVNLVTNYMSALCESPRVFPMTQQLIIYALRCYYGDWIVVYREASAVSTNYESRKTR